MKAKILLVALAAAASLTTPAHAATGADCLTWSTSTPWRVAQSGPDLAKASLAVGNYCADQAFGVDLSIWSDNVCRNGVCSSEPTGTAHWIVHPLSENGFEVTGSCYDGTARYSMQWEIHDHTGWPLVIGNTAWVTLTCEDDVPAGPGIECPKYIYELCRNISKQD